MKKLIFLAAITALSESIATAQPTATAIKSGKAAVIPFREVNNAVWNDIQATTIPVLPQNITTPMLTIPSVKNIKVKSINDGTTIAFLLEWTDSTKDMIVDADKFCDQVAIQLPMHPDTLPIFMMGNKNGRVHIIHWKALWQNDIENGFRDVKDAYPNYWADIYPMAEKQGDGTKGKFAKDISALDYSKGAGKNFMPAAYAGNPMSIFDRKEPSEECMAESYGTLTTQTNQNATAWGVWENNTWKVIFTRPMVSPDKDDAPVVVPTKIAFAIWNGHFENISGKKHYSQWVDLTTQK